MHELNIFRYYVTNQIYQPLHNNSKSYVHYLDTLVLLTKKNSKINLQIRLLLKRQIENILTLLLKHNLFLFWVYCNFYNIISCKIPIFHLWVIGRVWLVISISTICYKIATMLRVSTEKIVSSLSFFLKNHSNPHQSCYFWYFECNCLLFYLAILFSDRWVN